MGNGGEKKRMNGRKEYSDTFNEHIVMNGWKDRLPDRRIVDKKMNTQKDGWTVDQQPDGWWTTKLMDVQTDGWMVRLYYIQTKEQRIPAHQETILFSHPISTQTQNFSIVFQIFANLIQ